MFRRICNLNCLGEVLFIASYAKCPRVWKMASTLANNGFKVTILEWDRESILPAAEHIKNIYVRRMQLKASYGLKLIFKLLFWQAYVFLFILVNQFRVVQPQNLDNLLPAWIAYYIRRFKIVYDIADFYADAFVPSKMVLAKKIISWLEKVLIKAVNASILVDESRVKQIGLVGFPFWIIYNSPMDYINKIKTSPTFSRAKFVVFYAGILACDRGLDLLIEAVQDIDNVELVIAGFGEMEKNFSKMVIGKHNVRFLGRISYKSVLKFTFLSDCVVALYDPRVPNNVFASPNKLFEAMMCSRPIIVSNGTAMANIVRKENCGLIVDYDVEEVRNAILRLKNDPSLRKKLGENGRRAFEQKYNWNLMEKRLLRLYDHILKANIS